jgi:hypothetical protein
VVGHVSDVVFLQLELVFEVGLVGRDAEAW